jgi:hypothetical protein
MRAQSKMSVMSLIVLNILFYVPSVNWAAQSVLYKAAEKTRFFLDHTKKNRILAIAEQGSATWIATAGAVPFKTFNSIDPKCFEAPQDFDKLELIYPFLISLKNVCLIDEAANSIRFIGEIQTPVNAFGKVYVGEDGDSIYFLINGRPFDSEGYLKLLTIKKNSHEILVTDFITQVPGYSGGASYLGDSLFVTIWDETNQIYQASIKTILALARQNKTIKFSDLLQKLGAPFEGLSLSMFANQQDFVFINDGYDSYRIDRNSGVLQNINVPIGCIFLGGWAQDWLLSCGDQELRQGQIQDF